MKNLYDILGINKDANKEEIKKAHRNGVKKNHPDKGGDPDTFREIQLAYDVLSDDAKKERYDKTGETEQPRDTFHEMFASFIDSLLTKIMINNDDNINLIEIGTDMLNEEKYNLEVSMAKTEKTIALLEKALGRMESKKDSNLMAEITRAKIKQLLLKKTSLEDGIDFFIRALEEFDNFIYNYEEVERKGPSWTFITH